MKKVIYSITKLGKIENTKVTGIGYITDEDLITAYVSKTGKRITPRFGFVFAFFGQQAEVHRTVKICCNGNKVCGSQRDKAKIVAYMSGIVLQTAK